MNSACKIISFQFYPPPKKKQVTIILRKRKDLCWNRLNNSVSQSMSVQFYSKKNRETEMHNTHDATVSQLDTEVLMHSKFPSLAEFYFFNYIYHWAMMTRN